MPNPVPAADSGLPSSLNTIQPTLRFALDLTQPFHGDAQPLRDARSYLREILLEVAQMVGGSQMHRRDISAGAGCGADLTSKRRWLFSLTDLTNNKVVMAPAASAPQETLIASLYRLHARMLDEGGRTLDLDHHKVERLFDIVAEAFEAVVMALPSTCAADLAAKMLIAHCGTTLSLIGDGHQVWEEARALIDDTYFQSHDW
jgi:hypothetical protein